MNGVDIALEHSEEVGMTNIAYNKTIIDEIMAEDFPDRLPYLQMENLMTTASALAQFILFIAYDSNRAAVVHKGYKRALDTKKYETIIKHGIKGRS